MTRTTEELILAHLHLVESIAKQVAKRTPQWIDMDDLVAAGNVGLVEAANRYDCRLHPNFAIYAHKRIRGAMIDAYRGRNYPRLMQHLPDAWTGIEYIPDSPGNNERNTPQVPAQLIDPAPSPEAQLIYKEESLRLTVEVLHARNGLTLVERRTIDQTIAHTSLRTIGKKAKRSATWAHYTVHRARKKLRQALADSERKAA